MRFFPLIKTWPQTLIPHFYHIKLLQSEHHKHKVTQEQKKRSNGGLQKCFKIELYWSFLPPYPYLRIFTQTGLSLSRYGLLLFMQGKWKNLCSFLCLCVCVCVYTLVCQVVSASRGGVVWFWVIKGLQFCYGLSKYLSVLSIYSTIRYENWGYSKTSEMIWLTWMLHAINDC